MTINQETLEGGWNQIKGEILERWGQLADSELDQARGSVDQLVGLIQEKTGEAKGQVESFLAQAVGDGATVVSRAAEAVRNGASHAAEVTQQAMEKTADTARAGYDQAGELIRRRPMESLGVCFGVGLITGVVVGLLIRSK